MPFPLRVLGQPNGGAARARNTGWRAATGEIILFLDDDMQAEPDVLARHDAAHRGGADAVTGAIGRHPDSLPTMLTDTVDDWYERFAEEMRDSGRSPRFDEIITGHMSVRRAVLESLGGFDERFCADGTYGNEDIDLGHRLLAAGHRIVADPDAVTRQRYVVTAAQHLAQYRQAGRADVVLARKHPRIGAELFDRRRADSPIHRMVWRPVLAAPWLAALLHAVAAPVICRRVDAGRRSGPLWWALFVLREVGYWRGVAEAGGIPSRARVRVLCYHAVADLSADAVLARYGVPAVRLREQLAALRRAGWRFVGGEEVIRALAGEGGLPRHSLLITFDDCYVDLLDAGLPVLHELDVPAVAFAVSGRVGGSNTWDQALGAVALPLLDADGLTVLIEAGLEVGGHGATHRPLAEVADGEVSGETVGAVDALEQMGLPRPRLFAYPHGSHDARSSAALRAAGVDAAFTVDPGIVTERSDRYVLPRLEIFADDLGWRLRVKVALAGRGATARPGVRRLARRLRGGARRVLARRPS